MIDQVCDIRIIAPLDPEPARTFLPMVSIVIPALNEERYIESCLASLVALSIPRDSFEVLLVDNGSTDRTVQLAETFHSLLELTVLRRTGVRVSALRNYGASQARGDILVFLDADCLARPDWLPVHNILAERLAHVGVLGATYDLPLDSTWVSRAWEQRQRNATAAEVRYVPGGGMFLRREVFEALNGFDESLETNEDAELCRRVRATGMPVVASRSAAVVHLGTSRTLGDFYRRQRWHGAHVFKVFLRSPGRSGNEKAVLLAASTLCAELATFSGLVAGAITGRWTLLLLGVCLLLAPASVLALRRGLTSGQWSSVPGLFALYMTYGVARANCLLATGKRKR